MTDKRRITLVFYASFFTLGLTIPLLGVTIHVLAARFGIPLESAGQLQTAMSLGAVSTSIFVGRLYDRVNARTILPVGTGLLALSMVGLYLARNTAAGMVSAAILGIGFGIVLLGPNVLITRLNPENAAGSLNALNFSYGVGAIVGPQLATLGTLLGDARLAYAAAGIALALVSIPMAFVNMAPPPAGGDGGGPVRPNFRMLVPFVILFYCNMGVEVSFGTWIVTQAQTAARAPLALANLTASIFWIGYTASRALAALISRRVPATRLLIGTIGVMIAGYVLMLAAPASQTALMISALVIGIGTGPLFPSNMAITSAAFPRALGQVTGLLSAIGNTGPMTVPLLQGFIGQGRDGGMQLLLGLSVLMLAAAIYVGRRQGR